MKTTNLNISRFLFLFRMNKKGVAPFVIFLIIVIILIILAFFIGRAS